MIASTHAEDDDEPSLNLAHEKQKLSEFGRLKSERIVVEMVLFVGPSWLERVMLIRRSASLRAKSGTELSLGENSLQTSPPRLSDININGQLIDATLAFTDG